MKYEFKKDSYGYVIVKLESNIKMEERTALDILEKRLNLFGFKTIGYFYEINLERWYATTIESLKTAYEIFNS